MCFYFFRCVLDMCVFFSEQHGVFLSIYFTIYCPYVCMEFDVVLWGLLTDFSFSSFQNIKHIRFLPILALRFRFCLYICHCGRDRWTARRFSETYAYGCRLDFTPLYLFLYQNLLIWNTLIMTGFLQQRWERRGTGFMYPTTKLPSQAAKSTERILDQPHHHLILQQAPKAIIELKIRSQEDIHIIKHEGILTDRE